MEDGVAVNVTPVQNQDFPHFHVDMPVCAHETHGYNIYGNRYKTTRSFSGLTDVTHWRQNVLLRYRLPWEGWGSGKLLIPEVESPPREQKLEIKQVQITQKLLIER